MREEDKPFIYYKQGWTVKIVSRNPAGWRATALWSLPLLTLVALYIWLFSRATAAHWVALIAVVYVILLALWAIAMFRWMKARSEIVNVEELLEIKRKRERERSNRRKLR